MGYAIQMCEKQASGPPRVFLTNIERRTLDTTILMAKARLDTAPIEVDGVSSILDYDRGGRLSAAAVFIRVVELDSDGSPTDQVVFEYPPTGLSASTA